MLDQKTKMHSLISFWPQSKRYSEVTFDEIIQAVSEYTSVSPKDIRGRSRKLEVVHARHLTTSITRLSTSLRVQEIARKFGVHHGSIIHTVRKMKDLYSTNRKIRMDMQIVCSSIQDMSAIEKIEKEVEIIA